MKNPYFVVIEDELPAYNMIEYYLKNHYGNGYSVKYFDVFDEAIASIEKKKPDLIFLDLNLGSHQPEGSKLYEQFNTQDFRIVITTAYSDRTNYFVNNLGCYGFITKPLDPENFHGVLERFDHDFSKNLYNKTIILKVEYKNVPIDVDDILYIKGAGKQIEIKTAHHLYKTTNSLANISEELPNEQFVRVHKSYIVNANEVNRWDNEYMELKNCNHKIPIGRKYRDDLNKRF